MQLRLVSYRMEAIESEQALLRGETDRLAAATGLVFGTLLTGGVWSVIGLLAWWVV